jgi:hypothetical protein
MIKITSKLAGHATSVGTSDIQTAFWWERQKKDKDVEGKIILKQSQRAGLDTSNSWYGPVESSSEIF